MKEFQVRNSLIYWQKIFQEIGDLDFFYRLNASRKSHAKLDEAETLDDGDPVELGGQYKAIKAKLPWLNVFGGCCGSDLRHVTQIARALAA